MLISKYEPLQIETKWQKVWDEKQIYKTPDILATSLKLPSPKKYILDMFPYPSGAGLHVGHMEGYVATDVIARYYRMKGFSVLHPMGWDAFGLPAENYAIKNGVFPNESTHKNIENFRYQLKLLGLSYDWNKEIDTSSPDYYKWTQWLFILLFKHGLAYKKKAPANWCPKDETVLANEQVVDGKCERCDTEVVKKDLDQWFFKITDYADRLLDGLTEIDWLDEVKKQQINWIGRKEGALVKFSILNSQFSNKEIEVFTTRPDTIFGATFLVLSPDHQLVSQIARGKDVMNYVQHKILNPKESHLRGEKKTGVDTGFKAINPATNEEIPIFIADYVLAEIGTGAIMGVPIFDQRDLAFAKEHDLPIKKIEPDQEIFGVLKQKGIAKSKISYHIRDWLISRQRYWGCPIPMIFCNKCGWNPVPDADLPVKLPTDVDFRPTGESPIARSKTFQDAKCPKCGQRARREIDTMDGFICSSWYFLRFADPKNGKEFASRQAVKTWLPVDSYVGGGHVVQHLLFARFFWKALFDQGYIDKSLGEEPFLKLRAPGWILGPDSRKMSKRWGNVITPEEVVAKHGADTMRVYEMFMAPFEVTKPWSVESVAGINRFLSKIYNLFYFTLENLDKSVSDRVAKELNKTIAKVGEDIEKFRFNTAISQMMIFINEFQEQKIDSGPRFNRGDQTTRMATREVWEKFLLVLSPFAPHLAEELYQQLAVGGQGLGENFVSVHQQSWPSFDGKSLEQSEVSISVMINAKPRGVVTVAKDLVEEKVKELVMETEFGKKYLEGKEIVKTIFVPGKVVNYIVK